MARTSPSPDRPHRSENRYRNRDAALSARDDPKYGRQRDGDTRRDRPRRSEHEDTSDGYRSRHDNTTEYHNYSRTGRGHERDRRRGRDRDRDRDLERARGRDTDMRGGPSRRSASPRRPTSRAQSKASSKREDSPEDKAKPNFAPSGLLAAATKTVQHVDGTSTVLKYHEPPEARKPAVGWRLYVFKGKEQVGEFGNQTILRCSPDNNVLCMADLLHIQRQSAYLIGRDRTVADLAIEHPSCSKQHAVIQCMLAISSFHIHVLQSLGFTRPPRTREE